MGRQRRALLVVAALCFAALLPNANAQVIEFESNGLRYYAATRNGLTIMVAPLPAHVRDYAVIQVAVSNGGKVPQTIRPEDFVLLREDGTGTSAVPPRIVVNSLTAKASRSDVIKLVTSYEQSIYGNNRYSATNGYEQRRQSYMTDFSSTRIRAAAAASAIAFVQTKLAPGQSTDGAIFYPAMGKTPGGGTVRVQAAGGVYEFPLTPMTTTTSDAH
jgi:hypothetical protein